jgi:two-component system OmpR family response regulator
MTVKILLVEDDRRVASFVTRGLEAEGYVVDLARDGREALGMIHAYPYRIAILDRMIPYIDGLQVCRTLRGEGSEMLVLMLTAKDSLQDTVDGLTCGADDYLTKPFAFDELLARIGALLRRAPRHGGVPNSVLVVGDLRLDKASKRVWRGTREIMLTAREYAVLAYLMENVDAVVSRSRLLSEVWNLSFDPGSKLVDVYIRYLRQKLDADGDAEMIRTVRGFGYMITLAEPKDGLPDPDCGKSGGDEVRR